MWLCLVLFASSTAEKQKDLLKQAAFSDQFA